MSTVQQTATRPRTERISRTELKGLMRRCQADGGFYHNRTPSLAAPRGLDRTRRTARDSHAVPFSAGAARIALRLRGTRPHAPPPPAARGEDPGPCTVQRALSPWGAAACGVGTRDASYRRPKTPRVTAPGGRQEGASGGEKEVSECARGSLGRRQLAFRCIARPREAGRRRPRRRATLRYTGAYCGVASAGRGVRGAGYVSRTTCLRRPKANAQLEVASLGCNLPVVRHVQSWSLRQ